MQKILITVLYCNNVNMILIQCVPLGTKPDISLIILPLMSILQQNLKQTYLIV